MDIFEVRKLLKTKSIYDVPLRVTFYARVSTDTDEQLNSLENQVDYYENFIKSNLAWTYVKGYVDEGLSGISTKNRKRFQQMITDAKEGKFDFIVTKEISRFARNTVDSLQNTRDLLHHGVGVYFQNDNINTLDEDSELRLTIMSSIAQDELRKLSSRIKFGHQQAIKSKVVLGNGRILGYKKSGKHLVIDEEQAPLVRELFELYSTDQYSMKQLENHFYNEGYRNYNGKKIAHSTLAGVLANPKYKGYYCGNKVRIVDMFTKEQKFLPPEEWVMFKDETGEIVPAIVSEEIWDKANRVLKRRSDDVKNRQGICNHANLLTGKMYCAHCGKLYYRRDSKDRKGNVNSKWVCSGKINNGADSCPSFAIYESEIKPLLFQAFQETKVDAEKMLAKYQEMYNAIQDDNDAEKRILSLKKNIEAQNVRKSTLLDLVVEKSISPANFKSLTDQCEKDIKDAQKKIKELEKTVFSNAEYKKHMEEMKEKLREAIKTASTGLIDKNFVDEYIDKIIVTPQGPNQADLQIKVLTGQTNQKWLANLNHQYQSRMGHMTKKMVEKYENDSKTSK